MSNCCNPPGVGPLPQTLSEPVYETYNPNEVRLYGRPVTPQSVFAEGDKSVEDFLSESGIAGEDSAKMAAIVKEAVEHHLVNLFKRYVVLVAVDGRNKFLKLPVDVNIPSKNYHGRGEHYIKSIGVIYGYAYEGHCYTLPKQQIMYLPREPREILGTDCGYDCGYVPELGYAVWQIDKFETVLAVDVRSDDVKALVLDENLPGSRSPMAYAQTMSMAPQRHRD